MPGSRRAQCASWSQQSPGRWHRNGRFWQQHGIHPQGWKGPVWIRTMVMDLYEGCDGHRTRVIVAYNACKNNKKDSQTTYQQQRQYFITKKKDLTFPKKLFWLQLLQQLIKWRAAGD